MIDSYLKELRNIRITLVIMTILIAFTSGSRNVTVDHQDNPPQFNYSNMVSLENGHFGILSSDSQTYESELLKILYYDSETNEVILKKEVPVSSLAE